MKLLPLFLAGATLGGGGPIFESEPNDRLHQADLVGTLAPGIERTALGRLRNQFDADSFRFEVAQPGLMDLSLMTGAESSAVAVRDAVEPGGPAPESTPFFYAAILIFDAQDRLVLAHEATEANILILGLPMLEDFTVQVRFAGGTPGPYSLGIEAR